MGKALIFSAPSGSGKTTIVKHLLTKFPKLCFSISATTRKPRENEIDGLHYNFLTLSDFQEEIARDGFVEFEEVYRGTYYGTLKSQVQKLWQEGRVIVFDVDVAGGVNIKKQLGDDALAIFVRVPNEEVLLQRLKDRNTETEESLKTRKDKFKEEMTFESKFDRVLVNDDLTTTLTEAEQMVSDFISN